MAWLVDWIRQLLHLVFLVLLLRLLLPDNDMKGYVKVVMGLVVLAALLQPLAGLVRSPDPLAGVFDGIIAPQGAFAADEWVARGQSMGESARARLVAQYEAALAAQIEALVPLVYGVERAEVTRMTMGEGGDVQRVELEVVASPGSSPAEVQALLEKFFHIPAADVKWFEQEPEPEEVSAAGPWRTGREWEHGFVESLVSVAPEQ